jgi:hypothetical protein
MAHSLALWRRPCTALMAFTRRCNLRRHNVQQYIGRCAHSCCTCLQDPEPRLVSRSSEIKFDRSEMPRGFVLGMTRLNGKQVASERPVFTLPRTVPAYLPEVSGPGASAKPAEPAKEPAPDHFGISASVQAGANSDKEDAYRGIGHTEAQEAGPLDDDFVPLLGGDEDRSMSGASAETSGAQS